MNTPCAILNLRSTGDPAAAIRYFSDPKKVSVAYDGLATGLPVGSAKELADLLLFNHHDRRAKRVCRTAVISVQTPANATKEQLADIDRRLLQAASDLQKILKVASMLGWVHGNTATRHIHLIFGNSNGRRALDLRPKFLRQLQGFQWTLALLSGRGKGRRKALPAYPHARKLAVRDLAAVLVDDYGRIRRDKWEAFVKAGKISNFRRRKNGEVISFEYGGNGRRVRVATLEGFITECQNTRHTIEEQNYETKLCPPCNGQAAEPNCQPSRVPATNANRPALAGKTGPGECGTLPPFAPTKPTTKFFKKIRFNDKRRGIYSSYSI